MAKNSPVAIWAMRQIPRSDPKFHSEDRLTGAGRSINELLIIFIKGWVLRSTGAISVLIVEYNNSFSDCKSRLKSL